MTEIEHFSGSSLNLYDEDIHQFYTRYVLWQEPQVFLAIKEAMEFASLCSSKTVTKKGAIVSLPHLDEL